MTAAETITKLIWLNPSSRYIFWQSRTASGQRNTRSSAFST